MSPKTPSSKPNEEGMLSVGEEALRKSLKKIVPTLSDDGFLSVVRQVRKLRTNLDSQGKIQAQRFGNEVVVTFTERGGNMRDLRWVFDVSSMTSSRGIEEALQLIGRGSTPNALPFDHQIEADTRLGIGEALRDFSRTPGEEF